MIPGSGRSAGEGILPTPVSMGLPVGSAGKESLCNVGDLVDPWVGKDALEKETVAYSNILTWKISWTVESMELQRI